MDLCRIALKFIHMNPIILHAAILIQWAVIYLQDDYYILTPISFRL